MYMYRFSYFGLQFPIIQEFQLFFSLATHMPALYVHMVLVIIVMIADVVLYTLYMYMI